MDFNSGIEAALMTPSTPLWVFLEKVRLDLDFGPTPFAMPGYQCLDGIHSCSFWIFSLLYDSSANPPLTAWISSEAFFWTFLQTSPSLGFSSPRQLSLCLVQASAVLLCLSLLWTCWCCASPAPHNHKAVVSKRTGRWILILGLQQSVSLACARQPWEPATATRCWRPTTSVRKRRLDSG